MNSENYVLPWLPLHPNKRPNKNSIKYPVKAQTQYWSTFDMIDFI